MSTTNIVAAVAAVALVPALIILAMWPRHPPPGKKDHKKDHRNHEHINSSTRSEEEATPRTGSAPSQPGYKAMTFNILAPDYANPSWFPGTSHAFLRWKVRKPKILDLVCRQDPDLLCLQEVQFGRCYREISDFLDDHGYDTAYSIKCSSAGHFLADRMALGVMACWKRDQFRQIGNALTINLASYTTRLCNDDTYFTSGNCQVAVATLLQPVRETHRYIVLLSTHMMAPRGDHDYRRKYEHLLQTLGLLRAIADLKADLRQSGVEVFQCSQDVLQHHDGARLGCAPVYAAGSSSLRSHNAHNAVHIQDNIIHRHEQSDVPGPQGRETMSTFDVAETKSRQQHELESCRKDMQSSLGIGSSTPADPTNIHVTSTKTALPKIEFTFLLCGDFNMPPDSASCAVLKHGLEEATPKIKVQRQLFIDSVSDGEKRTIAGLDIFSLDTASLPTFDSAFETVHGTEPRHTNYTAKFRDCIDYIFIDPPNSNEPWLRPSSVSTRPHFMLDELFHGTLQRSLPSEEFPSDHLPVVTTFQGWT